MPFHLQAKAIFQNTRQTGFVEMKALSLSMDPTINSNMFSKWFDDALVFGFFSFFLSFEDSVCFSSLIHLICPSETFKY